MNGKYNITESNDVIVSVIFNQASMLIYHDNQKEQERISKTCIAINRKALVKGDSKMTERANGHE